MSWPTIFFITSHQNKNLSFETYNWKFEGADIWMISLNILIFSTFRPPAKWLIATRSLRDRALKAITGPWREIVRIWGKLKKQAKIRKKAYPRSDNELWAWLKKILPRGWFWFSNSGSPTCPKFQTNKKIVPKISNIYLYIYQGLHFTFLRKKKRKIANVKKT